MNLGTGFQFCFGKYILVFKHLDGFWLYEGSGGIHHGPHVGKTTFFCLGNPVIGIAVSIENHFLMFFQCFLDQSIYSFVKIRSSLQFVRHFFQYICHRGI